MYEDFDWYDILRCQSWLINTLPCKEIGLIFKALFADEKHDSETSEAMAALMSPAALMLYKVMRQDACWNSHEGIAESIDHSEKGGQK